MATDTALPLTLGVIALVGMPAAIAAVICADEVIDNARRRAEQVRDSWQEQRTIDRMERAFAPAPPAGPPWAGAAKIATDALSLAKDSFATFAAQRLNAAGFAPAWLPVPATAQSAEPVATTVAPVFEEVVARLRQLPRTDAGYDPALRAACRCLALPEHLDEVTGLDLEIERLRVEGALIAAGVSLSDN